MKLLVRSLAVALLAVAQAPSAAHAQFFGGGFGGYGGYGGYGMGGYGMGGYGMGGYGMGGYGMGGYGMGGYGMGGYGMGGYGMGGYGMGGYGFVSMPSYFTTSAFIRPIVYTVSTPPRQRPTEWPAIPYRDAPIAGTKAHIDVRVPASSAQVWFDGQLMSQTGLSRHYVTPPLDPASNYTFTIRASWLDAAGKEIVRLRQIAVQPGGAQSVEFRTTP